MEHLILIAKVIGFCVGSFALLTAGIVACFLITAGAVKILEKLDKQPQNEQPNYD
jgi:hypothetical protein